MEPPLLTACPHLNALSNPHDIHRISRAAIAVAASLHRPVQGLASERVPRCLHPNCPHPAARPLFVCVQCVHIACHHHPRPPEPSHLVHHFQHTAHPIYLSVDHFFLYCVVCEDFVFNHFLDAALALQFCRQRAHRIAFSSNPVPDPAIVVDPNLTPNPPSSLHHLTHRLFSPSVWAPTDQEIRAIAAHATLFPIGKAVRPPGAYNLANSCFAAKAVRPPVGLLNLGNSCYMNSVLQAFLSAPPLRNFFLADLHRHACPRDSHLTCFACAIDRLVCESCFVTEARAFGREKGVLSTATLPVPFLVPHTVLDIVWRHVDLLASYAQHDAHEFLIHALNLLHVHCRREAPSPLFDPVSNPKHKAEPVLVELKLRKDAPNARALSADLKRDPADVAIVPESVARRAATSIVQGLFSGTLQSDVICRVCANSSPTLETFYAISLDVDKPPRASVTQRKARGFSPNADGNGVLLDRASANGNARSQGSYQGRGKPDGKARMLPDSNGYTDNGWPAGTDAAESVNSLHECLSRFTEPEMLGAGNKMHCVCCGCRQESMKHTSIRTLPPIVCFHFKRFEQSLNVRRSETVKINTSVEFPADGLDLSDFQTSEILRKRHATGTGANGTLPQDEVRENEQAIYDLFAVVNHMGKIDSGHYTALVRREGSWFRCDDEKVTTVKDMSKVVCSEQAYLVFYVQRYANIQFSDL